MFYSTLAGAMLLAPTVLAANSAGCGGTANMTDGTYTENVNGIDREYILQLPSTYDPSTPYKLIFGFHWLDGSMQAVSDEQFYGVAPISEDSAIFVAPNGIDAGWANNGGEDVTLTDQILETVSGSLCIDDEQIYSMGWSYGGSMSYALACARPDVFRAVAVMSGADLSGCEGGTTPVAYLGQHGTHDSVLDYTMGEQIRDTFVTANGCTPTDPGEPAPGAAHVTTEYEGCTEGYPVTWIAFDGDHQSTATDPGSGEQFTSGEIWSFFSQF